MTSKTWYKLKGERICPKCKNKIDEPGYTCCSACRSNTKIEAREKRKYYATIGICTKCGCRSTDGIHFTCDECRAKDKAYQAKRKARLNEIHIR